MATIKEELQNRAVEIRDERKAGANTALRVGSLLLAMINNGVDIDELSKYFLSKLDKDTAEKLITFKEGAEFGNYIDSITEGKGAAVDAKGAAQFESLEVRGFVRILEMIVNRQSYEEGDTFFTESGTIESVTKIDDTSYLLTLHRRWELDKTAFQVNDVVRANINTMLIDGSDTTSFFRVNAVDASANKITVVMYSDKEVPAGQNFPPSVRMHLSRWGNALNTERQSTWYVSSREGCIVYLEGVTKPILEESNYYLILGKLKQLDLFKNLPINYAHSYFFGRGVVIQDLLRVDFSGNPVYQIVDTGAWDKTARYIKGLDTANNRYIQNQAWFGSCCWRCMVPEATIGKEPRWNNTEWVCIVGDKNFSLSIYSSNGRFFRPTQVYTTLSYILKHGTTDITADASSIEWTRESDLTDEDSAWNRMHSESSKTVEITPQDMPSNWLEKRRVKFKVKINLNDGQNYDPIEEEIELK